MMMVNNGTNILKFRDIKELPKFGKQQVILFEVQAMMSYPSSGIPN